MKHRLSAILAADAAGYSRLMAADERATVAALEAARAAFRRQIEANQGRVIDMAGDSVLAVFESAAGAVTAALAVQSELDITSNAEAKERRMRFRVGMHLGDVIEKRDGSTFGDGVNIAARLQAGAEPGGVWVSDAVRGAAKSRVAATFEDRGEQQMKNIAEPVRAYCVRTANDRSVLRRPEERRRYTVFLRVAAGLEDPSAADALRCDGQSSIGVRERRMRQWNRS